VPCPWIHSNSRIVHSPTGNPRPPRPSFYDHGPCGNQRNTRPRHNRACFPRRLQAISRTVHPPRQRCKKNNNNTRPRHAMQLPADHRFARRIQAIFRTVHPPRQRHRPHVKAPYPRYLRRVNGTLKAKTKTGPRHVMQLPADDRFPRRMQATSRTIHPPRSPCMHPTMTALTPGKALKPPQPRYLRRTKGTCK